MGKWNWWLPKTFDRILPEIDFESGDPEPAVEPSEPPLVTT
jgi:hypothetical protein